MDSPLVYFNEPHRYNEALYGWRYEKMNERWEHPRQNEHYEMNGVMWMSDKDPKGGWNLAGKSLHSCCGNRHEWLHARAHFLFFFSFVCNSFSLSCAARLLVISPSQGHGQNCIFSFTLAFGLGLGWMSRWLSA